MTVLRTSAIPASAVETVATVSSSAQVTIEQVPYEGWSNAYRMSNGTMEVVIVPQIARVMRYAYIGGTNLLWNNPGELGKSGDPQGWRNFGGDKSWPWSQDDWSQWFKRESNWPPPPEADQLPQQAEKVGANTIRLTSPVIAAVGIRIVRDITLSETGTRLFLVTRIERVSDGFDTLPVGAWSITQTPFVTGAVVAHLLPGETSLAEGWKIMGDKTTFASVTRSRDGQTLAIEHDPNAKSGQKLGFDGDAIAGVIGDMVLAIRADSPSAKPFEWQPGDRGQVYISDAGTPYVEWEFTSPSRPLKKGESVTLTTMFEARKLAASRNVSEAAQAAARGKM